MELLSSKTLPEIQLFRHGRKSVYQKGNAWISYSSLISNSLVLFLFFTRKLMSTLSFQSWPLNSKKRWRGAFYAVLLPCVSPKIVGGLGSTYFGLAFSFLIPLSFYIPCAQRACVLLSKAASQYMMNWVFGSSLTTRFQLYCVSWKERVDGFL